MSEEKVFYISLIICGLLCAFTAWKLIKLKPEKIQENEKIARWGIPGAILGLIDLLWCIPHAVPSLLPESYNQPLMILAVVLAIASWKYLDYLFSRALGGFMILLAHYFLHEAFTWRLDARPLFSLLCYIFGTAGIFFAGKPYLLRDLVRKASTDSKWKYGTAGFLVIIAIYTLIAGSTRLAGV